MHGLDPLWLTLELASLTTLLLLVLGIPLAYWLAHSRFRLKAVPEALVSLPLVLPPTVLGFYLLLAFSPESAFGHFMDRYFHARLAFTFQGIVLASCLYSLPFMVQPLRAGFSGLPASLREAAYTLGCSKMKTVRKVLLPNMKPALLTGIVLSFAHTLGEFGVVLMVGGNIPGRTNVLSIAVFDAVQSLDYRQAGRYSGLLLGFSFLVLLGVYLIRSPFQKDPLS